jgi:hypothetical protein
MFFSSHDKTLGNIEIQKVALLFSFPAYLDFATSQPSLSLATPFS